MAKVVAIDLGSNTCRAIEYDCAAGAFGRECERIVKTADRMHETGRIDEGAVTRVIDALKAADELFDLKHTPYRAVTTAAMRMAANSEAVLAQIAEATGVGFEIIDADREAFYTLTAVRARLGQLGLQSDSLCMIDIGGGSTEVIFYQEGERVSQSFSIGIVTIAQRCDTPEEVRRLTDRMLQPVRLFVDAYIAAQGRPQTFVTTAGTPTTIAAFLQGMTYDSYTPGRINGFALEKTECEQALRELLMLDEKMRSIYVGVGRETLIVAGVVIVEMFYEVLGYDTSVVIDDGVREGVAIAFCEEGGS
ncbi:Ppx/GppA phosphatase family protein [Thiomicrolovo sp. ZZH C-3]